MKKDFIKRSNCYNKILSVSILSLFIVMSLLSAVVYFTISVEAVDLSSRDITETFYPFQDAYVDEDDPDVNTGSSYYLWVTRAPNKRTYIQFDFSSIPAGSVITSATLNLYQSSYEGSGDRIYDLYLVNNSWDEETITWNSLLGTTFGDVLTSSAIVNTSEGWKSWDVTFDVNACVNNISLQDHPYHGWMIRDHDEGISDSHGRQFVSKDFPPQGQEFWPKLEVICDIDTEPPIVTITSPDNGTTFENSDITITGYITDNVGIASVSYSHEWENGGSGGGAPIGPVTNFSFEWNVPLHTGWNKITISSTDIAGNSGNESIILYYHIIDNESPVVVIISPDNGTIFDLPDITVVGYITDNIGIVSFGSYHSWGSQGSGGGGDCYPVTNMTFEWNFTLHEGWNMISIFGSDAAGNRGERNITLFYMPNIPPVISNEQPTNNSTDVIRPPIELSVTIQDYNNDLMDIDFMWMSHDGQWIILESYRGVDNGTYNAINLSGTDWIWGNTTYIWSVNVTDGQLWLNQTYQYTTGGSRYDVNNNDLVNFQDAGLVWIHRTSEVIYDGLYDVNQDGQVNFQDAGLTWINRN